MILFLLQTATLMHSGTVGMGCTAYQEAQRNACLCDGKKLSVKQVKKLAADAAAGGEL